MEALAKLVDVTLVCDTAVYAPSDILVITQKIPNLTRDVDAAVLLQTLTMTDEDNQGAAMDIYFLDANVRFGNLNQPANPGISIRNVTTKVSVAATDWKGIGSAKIVTYSALNMPLKPASGTQDVYVAIVNGAGTPTFSASGLKMRLGLRVQ